MFESTRTGSLLHAEHESTMKALSQLEALLGRFTAKRPPDMADPKVRTALQDAVGCLANEIGRHFAFEEEYLFPLLSETGEGGIGEFLKEEHEAIRPLAETLVGSARAALKGDGFDGDGWRRFHEAASELVERETYHIQKEEMALLAAISSLLDEDQDAELAARYQMM